MSPKSWKGGLASAVISLLALAVASAAAGEESRVLIRFKWTPQAAERQLVREAGGRVKRGYHIVPVIAASLPEGAAERLRRDPRVAYIELDGRVWAIDAELDNSWGVKRIGAGDVHWAGTKGAGVNVAIIDTGIDYTHPDLDANFDPALLGYDFVNSDSDPMDDNGHGTHVAGIVAAEDDDSGVVGVAPEARLYGLKVLDAAGSGYWSDVIAAIEWAVTNGMDVINMSLGGGESSSVEAACQAAYDAGLVVVAAAGNDGDNGGWGENIVAPASYDSVIAVGATDRSDTRAWFSSTGSQLELMAPGVDVNSTLPGGAYGSLSGTSMASPHVAGTAALVLAARGFNNRDLRLELQSTADDLGSSGWDSRYGYGLVDADEAAGVSAPPSGPSTMYVESISFSASGSGSRRTLYTTVKVVDGGGNPLPGVQVEMTLRWLDRNRAWNYSGTTDATGSVTFARARARTGSYRAEVTSLTRDGYTWDTTTGVVSEDCELLNDGTVVQSSASPGGSTTMYVESINFSSRDFHGRRTLQVGLQVVDGDGNALASVNVGMALRWVEGGGSWDFSGTTNSSGGVSFSRTGASPGTYVATVTGLVRSGYTWDETQGVTEATYVLQ